MADARRTVPKTCERCGVTFLVRRDRTRQRHCSNVCAARRGADNNRFNGGLCLDPADQRWRIMCRDGTQMYYSRGVMAGEIGRLLTPKEIVHHKDEDTTNDDPCNLEIVTRAKHINMHRTALVAARWAAQLQRAGA